MDISGDDDSVRIGDNYVPLPGDDDDGRRGNEMNNLKHPWNCLGAPYLYVTVHDKTENVLKYSRDGCLLSTNVLIIDSKEDLHDVELRSMAVGKHKDNEALFIADASNHNSRILVFGNCIEDHSSVNYGRRPFVTYVTDGYHNSGVDHSYGVCLDGEGNIYVSNQHTDCVLRFAVGSFLPMKIPQALQLDHRLKYYDGTFVQFGLPKEHEKASQGIRAITHVHKNIWIAHEELSAVVVADVASGAVSEVIPLDVPVGLFHDEVNGVVYVSCKSKERGGIVYALDATTYRIMNQYRHHKMSHPTGLTVYDGILYVAEQNIGAILAFDIKTEEFIKQIVGSGDKNVVMIEQLALSNC
eukprot:CAMPEP_0119052534 /NCGR_PEP_ID=MMETSP1177-20130426/73798_1 /TAXON_ID=2985 /ORGANISM="Ochromonas sp, Strain CCMP1899" /LENGTH=354 /DNA_ID=CAMNT_0007032131 /DNA_START=329 /DNA_END=1394 /DNA_ORIENTATION=+